MSNLINSIFKNKKVNLSKLEPFGFVLTETGYVFNQNLKDCELKLIIWISMSGELSAKVLDAYSEEPYTLHLTEGAAGSFVGNVKSQYEEILLSLAEQCYEPDVFHMSQALEVIEHVHNTYGDELEFLWKKSKSAGWRRKDNNKWYGVMLSITKRQLGLDGDDLIEIIDLRIQPEELESLADHQYYFPGYHMNKKHWLTIILDDSIDLDEIKQRIAVSYQLAALK